MGGIILRFFYLVLGVPFKLAPDTINKSLEVPKVLLEEGLVLKLCDRSSAFVAALVLGLSEADNVAEESSSK